MMPSSRSNLVTSRAVNLATRSISKFVNARRKFSRFLRIVNQLRPA